MNYDDVTTQFRLFDIMTFIIFIFFFSLIISIKSFTQTAAGGLSSAFLGLQCRL